MRGVGWISVEMSGISSFEYLQFSVIKLDRSVWSL